MAVKHEIKSQLAKLLATEDLIVEHRKVDTAQFDVHTRVLTLPKWDKASNNVYDSLVAHEVGHALYTPDRNWFEEIKIHPSFVNIVEDVRIEKLMKRRYGGIAKTFYNGYNELNDEDFFDIDGKDLNSFNLADRANLYFKIGSFVNISFSTPEKEIINLIQNAETFDETLSAAEALYTFCKQELEDKQTEEVDTEQDSNINLEGGGNLSTDTSDDSELTVPDAGSNGGMENGTGSSNTVPLNYGDDSLEPEVETADALEEALKDLTDTRNNLENVYFELPEVDLKKIIIDNKFIQNYIDLSWEQQCEEWEKHTNSKCDLFAEVDLEYMNFRRGAQKEVNYLVKEFECKKAASAYARATTSRTGVLDTTKLHTYKFNEDLFKKITVLPDGKNHGLVFVLDWSGSMSGVILDTIKQLYNLLWFCKKVNIPFEVYAFTNCFPPVETSLHELSYEKKEGLVLIDETFSLMNLVSSRVSKKVLEHHMKNIFRIGSVIENRQSRYYSIPLGMNLSGTPLNETIIALHQILPKFKKENNLEKVQCVILTDGEASPIRFTREFRRSWESKPFMGSAYIHDRCILRNRKTGYTYSCEGMGRWADVTDLLLQDLRQTFSNVNFIGFRILGGRDASEFIRRYTGYEDGSYERIMKVWRKQKSFTIKNSGYHSYFGISSNTLSNDDEFEVQEDATKAQIKRAFVKSLKTRKMNKKILGEFVELVA